MARSQTVIPFALILCVIGTTAFLALGGDQPGEKPAPLRASFSPTPEPGPATGGQVPNGLDFTGLSPAQVSTATQILAENRCNCGCGMTLGECRVKDPSCSRSLSLGRQIVQDLKDGKDRSTVQSNLVGAMAKLQTPPPAAAPPPNQNMAYKIDITGSPYKGSKGASVTIVEFSDYQ